LENYRVTYVLSVFRVTYVVSVENYPLIGGEENTAKEFGAWNFKNKNGRKVACGTYLVVLTAKDNCGNGVKFKVNIGVREY
jgi:hypothetical protein